MAERKELDKVVKLDQFPSNSHSSKKKEEIDEHIHVKKITKGQIQRKPQSIGQRVKAEIISEDSKSVAHHLLMDILVPAIQDTIVDLVKNGIETLVYGNSSPEDNRVRRERGNSYVSYSSYYRQSDDRYRRPVSRRTSNYDDIVFQHQDEAESVLLAMLDMLDEYDFVTRGHFYELIGERTKPADFRWGWDNLNSAKVERIRKGYIIRLPREVAND